MIVSPFVLQWSEKKVGPIAINQRLVFDFGLPVGQYTPNAGVNVGSHTVLGILTTAFANRESGLFNSDIEPPRILSSPFSHVIRAKLAGNVRITRNNLL